MMLHNLQIAQFEHAERIRQFNIRAARGEFIRYPEDDRESWSERLGRLGRAIRLRFSRDRAQSLVVRPGADSA